jgi:hypothetical protein
MSAIIQFAAPAELLFQPAKKESPFANREPKPIRSSSIREPEQRFWKLSAHAVAPQSAMIELFVLSVFLVVALVGVVSCFAELSHLVGSDAIGHVAMRAIGGGVRPAPGAATQAPAARDGTALLLRFAPLHQPITPFTPTNRSNPARGEA